MDDDTITASDVGDVAEVLNAALAVTCESCGATHSISAPADDSWYGAVMIDDDGREVLVERVAWLCDECGETNHIDRDVAVKEADPDA